MNTPQSLSSDEVPTPNEESLPVTDPFGQTPAVVAIMWAIVGALASGGGAVTGAMVGGVVADTSDCREMFCGLEEALFGGLLGWGVGILIALGASVSNGGGTSIDKTARALSVILGVIALPAILVLPALI